MMWEDVDREEVERLFSLRLAALESPDMSAKKLKYELLLRELGNLDRSGRRHVVDAFNHFWTLQRSAWGAKPPALPGESIAPKVFWTHFPIFLDLNDPADPHLATWYAQALLDEPRPAHLFGYRFFPVGQGLFTAGYVTRRNAPPFRWVYDCGSKSGGALIQNGLTDLKRAVGGSAGKAHLDLVAISHFDADHVNGLIELLRHFSVGVLLLPYLDPTQRLKVMRAEGARVTSDLIRFLAAPTAFILGRDGAEVSTILLVPPASEAADTDREELPDEGPVETLEEDAVQPSYPTVEPPRARDDEADAEGLKSDRVKMLRPGGTIRIGHVWEFLPYNDAELAGRATPDFKRIVNKRMTTLLKAANRGSWDISRQALAYLNGAYDGCFGGAAKPRNLISLFLYSGPIGRVVPGGVFEKYSALKTNGGTRFSDSGRLALLLTGDGYLDTEERLTKLRAALTPARLHRAGVFQVMHHGSKNNFCEAVPAAVNPLASLFSSQPTGNPAKPGHPDKEVEMAFASFYPRQIDSGTGWSLCGAFEPLRR